MTFWLILLGMTLAALAFLALPFLSRRRGERRGDDVAVYKDQLVEIDRDLAAGRIAPEEAEASRIEVSRRLIKAAERDRQAEGDTPAIARGRRVASVALTLLVLPAVAAAFYYRLGAPWEAMPKPAVEAKGPNGMSLADMIARVEAHVRDNPEDGRSYEVLAPVYMRIGRFEDAINAWRRTLALLGDSAIRQAGLGEALVGQAQGEVSAEARAVFDKALALDGGSVPARYYLALAALQDGKRDEARQKWQAMLDGAPPDAAWTTPVRRALAELDAQDAQNAQAAQPGKTAPGPSANDVEAAAKMDSGDRNAFIRSMVARLADKLKQDGGDPEGWARLVRAYGVLGEPAKAEEATAEARKALAGDAEKSAKFEEALKAPSGAPR